MPRGGSNAHRACERCRRKKRKCNGNDSKPCRGCREGGVDCVDVETPRVSKADLRERLAQLQLINSENDTLLDFLSSKETSPADLNSILRRLSDGQPRAQVSSSLAAQRPTHEDECSQKDTSTITSPSVTEATSTVSPVATVLDSPTTSAGSISNVPSPSVLAGSISNVPSPSVLAGSISNVPSPSVLAGSTSNAPSPSVLAGINTQTSHFRANLEHYRLQLPQLLDLILSRDCLSFCPINRNDFRRDFGTGHGLYCSTALIDSLLALSTLLAMDNASLAARFGARSKIEDDELGQSFAREAIAALYNGTGLPRRIADIQALGILSLYCLSCNKLNDGKGFAADFGAAIIEQWHTEQPIDSKSLYFPDKQVHANICCAAVSSNSEYARGAGKASVHVYAEESEGNSVQCLLDLSSSIIDDAFFRRDLCLTPDNPRVIAAKLFQLTEWTYAARSVAQNMTFSQAVRVYQQGLSWYASFFQYTNLCGDRHMPLIFFVHTYYHFCVLCILTPYILHKAPIAIDGTLPEMVCKQAAGSIQELVKYYSQFCSNGKLLDFMPLFKTAALSLLEIGEAKTC